MASFCIQSYWGNVDNHSLKERILTSTSENHFLNGTASRMTFIHTNNFLQLDSIGNMKEN